MCTDPLLIGLTGGIGSGKSTVADLFAKRGVTVVDADVLAHRLSAPNGRAMPAIRAAFGERFVTPEGAMDRKAMRELVFEDDQARERLEAILHPMIREETEQEVRSARSPYVLMVIPLLLESGRQRSRVAKVLVVDCSEEEQIARVIRRNGLARSEVQAIMARQIARQERLRLADDIVSNEAGMEELQTAVQRLHEQYLAMALSRSPVCNSNDHASKS